MINKDTELRKLRPAEMYNLGLILNPFDNWKKLMASVPKEGSDNIPKFSGEYISIVEQAAQHERKLAAVIFLEEWATMGKKRPTMGLLLDLLMKNQLFRAADYLAQDILKVEPPQRPASGPAAPVDIDVIAEMLERQDLEPDSSSNNSDFCRRTTSEMRLSQVTYPSSVFDSTNDDNLEVDNNNEGVIEMQYAQSKSNQFLEAARIPENKKFVNDNHQSHNEKMTDSKSPKVISDLMKFSATNSNELKQYSQSDLLKFRSEKIDPNTGIQGYGGVFPDLSILGMNSSFEDNLKENGNYAEAINAELTSAELPACLAGFGYPAESSDSVDKTAGPDDQYFLRELVSAELPLCIKNITSVSLENANSSILSTESIDNQSIRTSETESEESNDSMSGIPCFVVEAGTKKQNEEKEKNVQDEPILSHLNSFELPVTVVEFQKR